MEGPAQVAAVEPAPTRTGPAGPSGGSDSGDKVQRVAMSLSVSWERAGPEEAEAPIRGGEFGVHGPPHRPPCPRVERASVLSACVLTGILSSEPSARELRAGRVFLGVHQ